MDIYDKIEAAMFAALGTVTKLSRSGETVIFSTQKWGRSDLSSYLPHAIEQAEAYGLDYKSVTNEQMEAWKKWERDMREKRRVDLTQPTTRFLIHAPRASSGLGSVTYKNNVQLIDGWGVPVEGASFACLSGYDPEALGHLGEKGVCYEAADYEKIYEWIDGVKARNTAFLDARIQDNNFIRPNGIVCR